MNAIAMERFQEFLDVLTDDQRARVRRMLAPHDGNTLYPMFTFEASLACLADLATDDAVLLPLVSAEE